MGNGLLKGVEECLSALIADIYLKRASKPYGTKIEANFGAFPAKSEYQVALYAKAITKKSKSAKNAEIGIIKKICTMDYARIAEKKRRIKYG